MVFKRNKRKQHDAADNADIAVLFVCMGNICRSPTAEAVFRARVAAAGLGGRIHIDSAGTHAYHVGNAPDTRARDTASARGISMDGQRARKVVVEDFARFDLIIAMDEDNLEILESMRPEEGRAELSLMLEHHPDAPGREVPDPYYGGARGFEQVFDLVEAAADGLLERVRGRLGAGRATDSG